MHDFPTIRFRGELRPSQRDVVEIARRQLRNGERRLHIVAPPGSGKTVLGLYLWAECIRQKAVVLSPNSAIQAQWAARTDLFEPPSCGSRVVSTQPDEPALLTSLTYQSVTMPGRQDDSVDQRAAELWIEALIESGESSTIEQAQRWIEDLATRNPDYHAQRLSAWRKKIREADSLAGESLSSLHGSSLDTLHRLKQHDIGLIILDECHHLLGHWGRVLADAHDLLDAPIVVGLTATPPDRGGRRPEDIQRYDDYFGPVDFEVPVPAVVKDGFLAPYQDLAYLVRPTPDELHFIANTDDQLHALVDQLCTPPTANPSRCDPAAPKSPAVAPEHSALSPPESLPDWTQRVLRDRQLPAGPARDWATFEKRDPSFALAARQFLRMRELALPADVPALPEDLDEHEQSPMTVLAPVLDRFIRHHLRRSEHAAERDLAERATAILRLLGVQITETGCQACASPVGRVMAYSRSKAEALKTILSREIDNLGDRIRAVVVADFERSSATQAELEELQDDECGGAIAAFRELVADPVTDSLDPVLVTGSTVLVDDDLQTEFIAAIEQWRQRHGLEILFQTEPADGYVRLIGQGRDWCPRVYVELITELFQSGLTRCLVGTRGLLGEGWDANRINVLIDLTTVTTSMTVNQLRGRSIRLDPNDPQKVANNWDVVCIAPEFTRGLADYERFRDKHQTLFGITDDGAVEKGIGHVHPAFTELKPEGVEESVAYLNADMLERSARRELVRELWKIGEPFLARSVRTAEFKVSGLNHPGGFPPFAGATQPWSDQSLAGAIGAAILDALIEARLIQGRPPLYVGERAGGYVRVFLEEADDEATGMLSTAIAEACGPIRQPRYVITRETDFVTTTLLSRILPRVIGKYFEKRDRHMVMLHAVPSVLAKNRGLVDIYQKHWNARVSPGEATYALQGRGEELVRHARTGGHCPVMPVHQKEVFL